MWLSTIEEMIKSSLERPDWPTYFMMKAILASLRSPSPKLKVGCVVVKDHRVISTGYNGFFEGLPHISISREGHEINTVHAEQNCICDAAKRGVSLSGGQLYVTHFPCLHCTKAILSSGITQVYYRNNYQNDPEAIRLFEMMGVTVFHMGNPEPRTPNPELRQPSK